MPHTSPFNLNYYSLQRHSTQLNLLAYQRFLFHLAKIFYKKNPLNKNYIERISKMRASNIFINFKFWSLSFNFKPFSSHITSHLSLSLSRLGAENTNNFNFIFGFFFDAGTGAICHSTLFIYSHHFSHLFSSRSEFNRHHHEQVDMSHIHFSVLSTWYDQKKIHLMLTDHQKSPLVTSLNMITFLSARQYSTMIFGR